MKLKTWYVDDGVFYFCPLEIIEGCNNDTLYGGVAFNENYQWLDNIAQSGHGYKKANISDVELKLLKLSQELGFKEGVKVKTTLGKIGTLPASGNFNFTCLKDLSIYMGYGDYCIYNNYTHKWAEIIEEEFKHGAWYVSKCFSTLVYIRENGSNYGICDGGVWNTNVQLKDISGYELIDIEKEQEGIFKDLLKFIPKDFRDNNEVCYSLDKCTNEITLMAENGAKLFHKGIWTEQYRYNFAYRRNGHIEITNSMTESSMDIYAKENGITKDEKIEMSCTI